MPHSSEVWYTRFLQYLDTFRQEVATVTTALPEKDRVTIGIPSMTRKEFQFFWKSVQHGPPARRAEWEDRLTEGRSARRREEQRRILRPVFDTVQSSMPVAAVKKEVA